MTTGPFIAVDWGTTNRRAYLIDNNAVLEVERDGLGILAVPASEFPAEISRLRDRHGNLPMILAGMVGSNRGWVDAGYVSCPADLEALAAAAVTPEPEIWVIPGVSRNNAGRADVMRGEEIQMLGAVAAGLAPRDALLCQPGTHSKWAMVENGVLRDFTTAMTGEMFALLQAHALIGSEMQGDVDDMEMFRSGVEASGSSDLLASLFGVRADAVLGLRRSGTAASYVSGLLIGADCRARLEWGGQTVHLLAEGLLARLYSHAIERVGGKVIVVDSHASFVAGISQIRKLME